MPLETALETGKGILVAPQPEVTGRLEPDPRKGWRRPRARLLGLVILDLAVTGLLWVGAGRLAGAVSGVGTLPLALAGVFLAGFLSGGYRPSRAGLKKQVLVTLAQASVAAAILVLSGTLTPAHTAPGWGDPLLRALGFWAGFVVLRPVVARILDGRAERGSFPAERVLVVGSGSAAARAAKDLVLGDPDGVEILGFAHTSPNGGLPMGSRVWKASSWQEIAELAWGLGADRVLLVRGEEPREEILRLSDALAGQGIALRLARNGCDRGNGSGVRSAHEASAFREPREPSRHTTPFDARQTIDLAEGRRRPLLTPGGAHMPRRHRIRLFGCPMDCLKFTDTVALIDSLIQSRRFAKHTALNVAKLARMQRDPQVREAVRCSEIISADGMPLVWLSRWLHEPLPERVTGCDLLPALVELAARKGYPVYFFGARPDVVSELAARYQQLYPQLEVAGYRDGYCSEADLPAILQEIRRSGARILFVATSSPRKELFLQAAEAFLPSTFCIGVGGAFDVAAGRVSRAPRWMQACGLEWLWRVGQEPRRLWKRYLVTNSIFLSMVVRFLWRRWRNRCEIRGGD